MSGEGDRVLELSRRAVRARQRAAGICSSSEAVCEDAWRLRQESARQRKALHSEWAHHLALLTSGPRIPQADSPPVAALRDEIDGLRRAMVTRAAIEQAKGMLMVTTGCTDDEAFQMLAKASQRSNRPVRDLAATLVVRGLQNGRGSARRKAPGLTPELESFSVAQVGAR